MAEYCCRLDRNTPDSINTQSFSRSPTNAYIHPFVDQWPDSRSAVSRVASTASNTSKQSLRSPTTEYTGSTLLLSPFQLAQASPQAVPPFRSMAASISDTSVDLSLMSCALGAPWIRADLDGMVRADLDGMAIIARGYVGSIRYRVMQSRPADLHSRSISGSADADDFDFPCVLPEVGDEIPETANITIEAMNESETENCSLSDDGLVPSIKPRLVDSITRIRHRMAPTPLTPVGYKEESGTDGQYHYRVRRNSIFAVGPTGSPSTSSMDVGEASCTSLYGPDLTPS